jgi:hypothetical protein
MHQRKLQHQLWCFYNRILLDQLQVERQELWVSPELLTVNRCINSETEYLHLLILPHTDYPPPKRLKKSTFAAIMHVEIHFYHISEQWLIKQKMPIFVCNTLHHVQTYIMKGKMNYFSSTLHVGSINHTKPKFSFAQLFIWTRT